MHHGEMAASSHLLMTSQETEQPRPRIALYSHDTMGLGHIRRNTLLAQALHKPPVSASLLLVSGIRESGAFPLPPGVDSITLPAYHKQPDGNYCSRSLDIPLDRLIALRSQAIEAALTAFAPDLLVVDNVPRGALGELDAALAALKARGNTRIVLGLRDIIDTPEVVARQWEKQGNREIVQKFFDAIWIYGDARLHDSARAYGLDTLQVPVIQVGYLDPSGRDTSHATLPVTGDAPYALCMMGGGQDGQAVAEAFAQAELPAGWQGIILTGSMMPEAARERLQQLAATRPGLQVHEFVNEPLPLIRNAEAVVAMGGYNSTMEVLALDKRVMLVPRVTPRAEQWLRASRLAELGLVHCLHPDALSPETISRWLAAETPSRKRSHDILDFGGLDRVARQVNEMLATPSRRTSDAGQ